MWITIFHFISFQDKKKIRRFSEEPFSLPSSLSSLFAPPFHSFMMGCQENLPIAEARKQQKESLEKEKAKTKGLLKHQQQIFPLTLDKKFEQKKSYV